MTVFCFFLFQQELVLNCEQLALAGRRLFEAYQPLVSFGTWLSHTDLKDPM